MNKKLQVSKYLLFDLLAAAISWTLFYIYRKFFIESHRFGFSIPIEFSDRFYLGLLIIPLLWILFYYITGFYDNIYRRSRLKELGKTFITSIVGVNILFFLLILDDYISSYKDYYNLFSILFLLHFFLTYLPRLIITSYTVIKIHKKKIGFNTLIIGNGNKAKHLFLDMSQQKISAGNLFIGYITIDNSNHDHLRDYLSKYGNLKDLEKAINKENIEEIIIAIENNEQKYLTKILTLLNRHQLLIWSIPELDDFFSSNIKSTSIFSCPLIQISNELLPSWKLKTKRLFDIFFSLISLIFFFPGFIIIAIFIKCTSSGPVIYQQTRIGKFGHPFKIYKLRSMINGAENGTPKLSNKNDTRITKIGKILRQTHLDEIPQFINVIKGDMSVVGPRPERKYYIDKIIKEAPHFTHLQKIKPGITSWGQVKYGYASNINEMIERLPYDIMYLKNISLYLDLKIIIYTLLVSIKGEGK